ncbi:hypothetical protein ACQ4M3_07520 [Leptolyngbya sp. AN03gr2]|uniref:hypothetical protein n=1 Tax=unclassified Leptolyngbya TaxID=2650499 RepID=UPI003D318120
MNRWALSGGIMLSAALISIGIKPDKRQAGERLPQEIELVYGQLLEKAQEKANNKDLEAAVLDVSSIPANSKYHNSATQFEKAWSKDLLREANEQYRQANISEAITTLKAIPEESEIFQQAQQLASAWGNQAKQLDVAIKASESGDWSRALEAVNQLRETELFSNPRVQELAQAAITNAFSPGEVPTQIIAATDKATPQLSAAAPSIIPTVASEPPRLASTLVDTETALVSSVAQDPQPQSSIASRSIPVTPQTTSVARNMIPVQAPVASRSSETATASIQPVEILPPHASPQPATFTPPKTADLEEQNTTAIAASLRSETVRVDATVLSPDQTNSVDSKGDNLNPAVSSTPIYVSATTLTPTTNPHPAQSSQSTSIDPQEIQNLHSTQTTEAVEATAPQAHSNGSTSEKAVLPSLTAVESISGNSSQPVSHIELDADHYRYEEANFQIPTLPSISKTPSVDIPNSTPIGVSSGKTDSDILKEMEAAASQIPHSLNSPPFDPRTQPQTSKSTPRSVDLRDASSI